MSSSHIRIPLTRDTAFVFRSYINFYTCSKWFRMEHISGMGRIMNELGRFRVRARPFFELEESDVQTMKSVLMAVSRLRRCLVYDLDEEAEAWNLAARAVTKKARSSIQRHVFVSQKQYAILRSVWGDRDCLIHRDNVIYKMLSQIGIARAEINAYDEEHVYLSGFSIAILKHLLTRCVKNGQIDDLSSTGNLWDALSQAELRFSRRNRFRIVDT